MQTSRAPPTSCGPLRKRNSGDAEGPAESRQVTACSRRSAAARSLSAAWQFREAAGAELKGAGRGETGLAPRAFGEGDGGARRRRAANRIKESRAAGPADFPAPTNLAAPSAPSAASAAAPSAARAAAPADP